MRILVATGIFPPEIGGPATYLDEVLPELSRHGHALTVVSFGDRGPLDQFPYPVHRVPRRHWLGRHWEYYRTAGRLWPAHDLTFVHSLGLPLPGRLRPRLGRIGGDPVWERAVNRGWVGPEVDVEQFQRNCPHPLVRLTKAVYHREVRRLDHVIVPCEFYRELAIAWGVKPSRITLIPNALRPTADPPETKPEARSRLGLPAAGLLLTVARLTPYKGIDYLIRAVSRLNGIHLLIVGDGPVRLRLVQLAHRLGVSDRVQFLGSMPRDQLPVVYRAADYTVVYAGGEGLSHTLLESLRVGTPVIASDKGGNPEIVRDGENGWLAPYADDEGLLRILERAFSPGEPSRCSANSSIGLERFSWGRMLRETVRLVESFSVNRQ
jgi:glycosyltransferase involved in cell wall biosynthesis